MDRGLRRNVGEKITRGGQFVFVEPGFVGALAEPGVRRPGADRS